MKNTSKKIIILGIAITIAVVGILIFYPTIVSPPTDVPVNNLHKSSLEANIKGFSNNENTSFNDSIYNVVVNKLIIYKNEKFMTEEEIDYQTKALVQKYIPIFTNLSHAKFNASNWRESDHKAMLNRIKHLRTLKVDYGETNAVTGSYETELNKIEQIISNYREAKKVARYYKFYSVEDAKRKINEAEKYRTMDPLFNCTELTNKLSSVKSNIGESHYDYIESIVNQMEQYSYMTKTDFDNLMTTVNNAIKEYNENRSIYGSDSKTTDDLKQRASNYYQEAYDFFN